MDIDPDKLYPPGQAAQLVGVVAGTLVNWEKRGLLTAHRKTGDGGRQGHRRYLGADLIRASGHREEQSETRMQLAGIMRRFSAWYCFIDPKGHFWAVRTIDPEEPITVHGATVDEMYDELKRTYVEAEGT
jgi:hypothetical protein